MKALILLAVAAGPALADPCKLFCAPLAAFAPAPAPVGKIELLDLSVSDDRLRIDLAMHPAQAPLPRFALALDPRPVPGTKGAITLSLPAARTATAPYIASPDDLLSLVSVLLAQAYGGLPNKGRE